MICPFLLKYFNSFEHSDIWSNLEENYLNSFRDSNKKRIYGTRNIKKHFMICLFLLKYFNNFEHQHICMILVRVVCWNIPTFFRKINQTQNFSCSTSVFIFLPCIKEVSFLEQNQFKLFKMIEILHQNGNFEIVCSIIAPKWRCKKFLYKAPIYLPIEDIFGQNG